MYLYPQHVDEELIAVLAAGKKVLPYLDLPLQHINDEVLRRMRRGVSRAETERLLDRLRGRIEGLVLRTTLIAGFPGRDPAAVRRTPGIRPPAAIRAVGGIRL